MSTVEIVLSCLIGIVYPTLAWAFKNQLNNTIEIAKNSQELSHITGNYKQGIEHLSDEVEKVQEELTKISKFIYSNLSRRKSDPDETTVFQ